MTITENDLIHSFGTEDEATSVSPQPGAVADTAFSVEADVPGWTNSDDAPMAMFRLKLTAAGLGGVPDGGTINLYSRSMDIDLGSSPLVHQTTPSATFLHKLLGHFPVLESDADQDIVIGPLMLPNYKTSSQYQFYIENQMGQTTGTGWQLFVKPITFGPHPA